MSDVLDELADCIGLIERGVARSGLTADWISPIAMRLWEVHQEVKEREERATRELDKCNCNRED